MALGPAGVGRRRWNAIVHEQTPSGSPLGAALNTNGEKRALPGAQLEWRLTRSAQISSDQLMRGRSRLGEVDDADGNRE